MAGDGWQHVTWGDLATLEYGKGLKGYRERTSGYRVYGTNGPIGWNDTALYDEPSVIIGRKGAYRGVHFAPLPFFVIDTAFYLKPKTDFEIKWAYYALLTKDINGMDSGSAIPSTSREDFYGLPEKVPPLFEQKAIAGILGALDDKIELNRRMNETLESMARAIFKSWFVDFDPVRAKMDGQEPPGMNPETAALFPDSFEEQDGEMVPKGWALTTLGEVIEIFDSKRIPLSGREREQRQGTYPYHGAASVMDYVDDYLFDGIYILMGEDGSVVNKDGSPVLQYVWGKFWVNNHAHVLRGTNGVSAEHLLLHLQGSTITPYVTGAVQPKLNQRNMKQIDFVLASPQVCEAFAEEIQPMFARVRSNSEESQTLANLRDTLLPKLLSGELRVPEAEKQVEEVA